MGASLTRFRRWIRRLAWQLAHRLEERAGACERVASCIVGHSQRGAVTVVLAIAVVGYFGNPERELLVFAGLTLLCWLPALRCPTALTAVAGVLSEASLFIYLMHHHVYPLFGSHRVIGVARIRPRGGAADPSC